MPAIGTQITQLCQMTGPLETGKLYSQLQQHTAGVQGGTKETFLMINQASGGDGSNTVSGGDGAQCSFHFVLERSVAHAR